MKIGFYIKKIALRNDDRIGALLDRLRAAGVELYAIETAASVQANTSLVLSFGGDGTFLSAAHRVAEAGIPVMGVNFGRMGFLSDNRAEDVADAILSGSYEIEERDVIKVSCEGPAPENFWPYAINEATLHRIGAEMLGVDVTVRDAVLPTYWADGVLVATSTGSTAYSLSAGGPICLPDSQVRLISPIAPHNLNLRPMVVPIDAPIRMAARARVGKALLSLDNRSYVLPCEESITIGKAPFMLRRVSLGKPNFIEALRSRFFWGQDVRNSTE